METLKQKIDALKEMEKEYEELKKEVRIVEGNDN